MNQSEVEGRIKSALEVAGSKDEARRFIEQAIEGEKFQSLQLTWSRTYRCVDVLWFDPAGGKHALIVDSQ